MKGLKHIFCLLMVLSMTYSLTLASANATLFLVPSTDTIYTQVDIIPQFSGGARGWSTFLNKNLNVRSIQESIDEDSYISFGLVQQANLEFTVCEDGKVCDVDVLNGDKISPEFKEEVLRVMKRSPRWKPAMRDGQPVKTRFRQPVIVNLKDR